MKLAPRAGRPGSPGSSPGSARSHPGSSGDGILLGLAAAKLLLHLASSAWTDYGRFIDENYYLACARHLAFGYVDHPPFSIWLLALSRALLGDSLPALRFLPALAGAATVFLTGRLARELGCGIRGQVIAALAALAAPVYLLLSTFYSMNPFELCLWTACCLLLVRILRDGRTRTWVPAGILIGVGLEFKHTMILYVIAVLAGIALDPARRTLRSRHFWIGALLAFGILLPNLIWQVAHGFPSLEFYRNAILYKNVPTSPPEVLVQQVLFMNPLALPLWAAGLGYLLFTREGRPLRPFGLSFVILLLFMIASRSSRPDRIVAAYPILFAGGARMVERAARAWIPRTVTGLILVGGIVLAPIAVPLLPPYSLIRYMSALHFQISIERGKAAQLPQWFADRFGWRDLTARVEEVCAALTPSERDHAEILAGSYGMAGALQFYGSGDLPPVVSGHNNYFLWGPGPRADSLRVLVTVLIPREELEGRFDDVRLGAVHECRYCMDYESRLPIYVARGPRFDLREIWPQLKHFE